MEEERRKSTPATPSSHRASFKDGAAKRNSLRCARDVATPGEAEAVPEEGGGDPQTPRVPHKFIANWRSACDRTRDKTKELLKRWRTLPEGCVEPGSHASADNSADAKDAHSHGGWSVHVWATWVRRFPSEDEEGQEGSKRLDNLSPLQRLKLTHFFSHLIDWDKDELISAQDFEAVSERLRHFADWSNNSAEFHVLKEVEAGFVDTFVKERRGSQGELANSYYVDGMATLDQWLLRWNLLLAGTSNVSDLPLWMQYFCKIIFAVINKSEVECRACGIDYALQLVLFTRGGMNGHFQALRKVRGTRRQVVIGGGVCSASGWPSVMRGRKCLPTDIESSGVISRDEMREFYSSFLGYDVQRVGEVLDIAYNNMTSNGDHQLRYHVYQMCFANFLLGRNPHGPGQLLFGPFDGSPSYSVMFPVDYSALNCPPDKMEQYSPHKKSNRHSVIV